MRASIANDLEGLPCGAVGKNLPANAAYMLEDSTKQPSLCITTSELSHQQEKPPEGEAHVL